MSNLHSQLRDSYAYLQGKRKTSHARAASINRLKRLLEPYVPLTRDNALDLGAGQGELVEALQSLGFSSVEGVELSPSQIHFAESHGCHVLRQAEGGQALAQYPDASLDLICCFDVFEHLSHDTCARWFTEIHRALKPGGRLIGHVPNGLSPFVGSVYWADLTHLWCPVPQSIQVFCRSSGLEWIGSFENIGASSGFKGRLRRSAWRVVRFLLAACSTIETGQLSFGFPWSRTFLFVIERPIS